jgi:hypothetical protein
MSPSALRSTTSGDSSRAPASLSPSEKFGTDPSQSKKAAQARSNSSEEEERPKLNVPNKSPKTKQVMNSSPGDSPTQSGNRFKSPKIKKDIKKSSHDPTSVLVDQRNHQKRLTIKQDALTKKIVDLKLKSLKIQRKIEDYEDEETAKKAENKPKNGEKEDNKPEKCKKAENKPKNGQKAENKPKNGEKEDNKPKNGKKAENQKTKKTKKIEVEENLAENPKKKKNQKVKQISELQEKMTKMDDNVRKIMEKLEGLQQKNHLQQGKPDSEELKIQLIANQNREVQNDTSSVSESRSFYKNPFDRRENYSVSDQYETSNMRWQNQRKVISMDDKIKEDKRVDSLVKAALNKQIPKITDDYGTLAYERLEDFMKNSLYDESPRICYKFVEAMMIHAAERKFASTFDSRVEYEISEFLEFIQNQLVDTGELQVARKEFAALIQGTTELISTFYGRLVTKRQELLQKFPALKTMSWEETALLRCLANQISPHYRELMRNCPGLTKQTAKETFMALVDTEEDLKLKPPSYRDDRYNRGFDDRSYRYRDYDRDRERRRDRDIDYYNYRDRDRDYENYSSDTDSYEQRRKDRKIRREEREHNPVSEKSKDDKNSNELCRFYPDCIKGDKCPFKHVTKQVQFVDNNPLLRGGQM